MFAFVSAFPKSLHCTDEAQQAETVPSAVLSITLLLLRAGEIPVVRPSGRLEQLLQTRDSEPSVHFKSLQMKRKTKFTLCCMCLIVGAFLTLRGMK